jgi:hypothetical protein
LSKPWLLTTALTLSAFAASAQAQEAPRPAAELLCSDIATLEEAHAAALVYYIAGYMDAEAAAIGAAPAGDPAMVGGLTLSAAAVLEACAATPDQRVADAITATGGSSGTAAAVPAPTESTPPAEGTAAPADGATAPADGAAVPGEAAPSDGTATPPADGATEAPAGTTTTQ